MELAYKESLFGLSDQQDIVLTTIEKQEVELIHQLSPKLARELELFLLAQHALHHKKRAKRKKLKLKEQEELDKKKSRLKLQYAAVSISQAIRNETPIREPKPKTSLYPTEPKPLLHELDKEFGSPEKYKPFKYFKTSSKEKTKVEEGDTVYFLKEVAYKVKVEDKEYWVVRERDILMKGRLVNKETFVK